MSEMYNYPEYEEILEIDDMPGDSIKIAKVGHEDKAKLIFPLLMEELKKNNGSRTVVSVYGGSGVGKTGIAHLLSYYLNANGIKAYTMSGDNYPHRIPKYNDMERERIYEELGREGLVEYLGSELEINYKEVNEIIRLFHEGENSIYLRRLGRDEKALFYENIDFSDTQVLILEWTHGNNANLRGIDIPIFLGSTPQETLEYRILRARDAAPDSPFVTMVLEIEQALLNSQAPTAKWIISKAGEIISDKEFMERVNEQKTNA